MSNDDVDAPTVGDTVTLNVSDGPEMVVSRIRNDSDGVEQCTCLWFEDQRQSGNECPIWVLKEVVLPIDVLTPV